MKHFENPWAFHRCKVIISSIGSKFYLNKEWEKSYTDSDHLVTYEHITKYKEYRLLKKGLL